MTEAERRQRRANGGGLYDFMRGAGDIAKDSWDSMNTLQKASMAPVPLLGDVAGLLGDAQMMYEKPEERTWANAGFAALGALPFMPAAGVTKMVGKAPMDDALATAQKNAAKSIEDGGLGLPMGNTAHDRAEAMGMGEESGLHHKTWSDTFDGFTEFDSNKFGSSDYGYAGRGIYTTRQPLGGSTYGNITMPLRSKLDNPYTITPDSWQDDELNPYTWIPSNSERLGGNKQSSKEWTRMMKEKGHDGFIDNSSKGGEVLVFEPNQLRSVNAAFDPARRSSADLLAGVGGLGLASLLGYNRQEDDPYAWADN